MIEFESTGVRTVAIAGVGLIGGSVAAAVGERCPGVRRIGVGRDGERLADARRRGLVDEVSTSLVEAAGEAELAVLCTPVRVVTKQLRELAANAERVGELVVTDAGSTKAEIAAVAELSLEDAKRIRFVGAHPLAGSDRQGHEFARADLYDGRVCVVVPGEAEATAVVESFWRAIGMRIVRRDAHSHDATLARTSHLPHVLASALAGMLKDEDAELAATGFRDTTRVAGGDPELWTQISLANRAALAPA